MSAAQASLPFGDPTFATARANASLFREGFLAWLATNAHVWLAFEREADKVWNRGRRHYSARTIGEVLRRIANGRRQHGDRFLAPFYGSGSGLTGRSLARPIGTITTRDRWAVIDGGRMRILTIPESRRAMGFRDSYRLRSASATPCTCSGMRSARRWWRT